MSEAKDTQMPPSTTVHLFLPSGKTFTFRNATIDDLNEHVLTIRYVAMSDGRFKYLVVQKSAVVGWSQVA